MSEWSSEEMDKDGWSASNRLSGYNLNKIKIPVAGLRNLAITLIQEGLTEIGLEDLLYRIREVYREDASS